MYICRKAVEAWDRLLHRSIAALLAAAMTLSFLPATSWAAYPITPPVQITDDTKSQFPNIEFQTNFVRTEYGTLTGLMELAIRVGPSGTTTVDGKEVAVPVDFQSVAATLQYNTTLFQPISWQWAYTEEGKAISPDIDLKTNVTSYYDVQLPAKKDDTLPGTGAIAQCGIVIPAPDGMSTNVTDGKQALLFFKAEAYGTRLEIAEMTTLAVIRFYVAPELMEHISIVRDKTSVQPDGSCDYDVFFDTKTQVTDQAGLDAAIMKTKGQTIADGAPAGTLDPDLTKILPTEDFISVGFALDGDMAESDSPANMSLHYSAGDNVFYYVPGYVPTDDPATNTTLTDVLTEVGPDKGKVKVTLRAPITGGSRVLAVAEGKDNSTTAADYSYTSNLIPSKNITFPVVSQVSFADNGDGRENMVTVLFYDWDDTLIGVLVVPRNDDARALVNDYVRDNMIHPDLRYVEGSADTLVDSLSRANSYRGKYPSTPMGENGTDTTMDGNRPATPEGNDKLVGSDYPLTNKLDYVFLKRPMEKDETAVDADNKPTNTWKQLGDETTAEWDYEYPYIHGWALIPDDDLTDIDYTHPENIWTTIGVGELATYTGLYNGSYPDLGSIAKGATELTISGQEFSIANFDFHENSLEKGSVYAVKAIYEPGEALLYDGYSYRMISEPYYNKMNSLAASAGAAFNVDLVFERTNINEDSELRGITRIRKPAVRQETTTDLRWENEYLENATIAEQTSKTKTTYTNVTVDNKDEVEIQLVLSGRHNKVDYYLIETYGASFVTGGGRSLTNRDYKDSAHVVDNYNYKTADNNTDRIYYQAEYMDTDGDGTVNDDRSGSYGFVLFGTLNNLAQQATEYANGKIMQATYMGYLSLANLTDANIRIEGELISVGTWVAARNAWQAAALAAQAAHNAGDDTWWDKEHNCAQFTYHQIQLFVSSYYNKYSSETTLGTDAAHMADYRSWLLGVAAADAITISWCNLHEECASTRTGKPTSFERMVRAALGEKLPAGVTDPRDVIELLTLSEAENFSHLRADERGTAFGSIAQLADAFVTAVQAINAISPIDPSTLVPNSDGSKDADYWKTWDTIQGYILSNPKPTTTTELAAATQLSRDTAWWNNGEDAPSAGNLQDLLAAAKKANDTGRDAWINYYRYRDYFTDMKTNGVSPQARWTTLTENLVKDINGNAFDDYAQFRTAIKDAVTKLVALGTELTEATWNEVQYIVAGDTRTPVEDAYATYWWHNGYSRIVDLPSLLLAAQRATSGGEVIWSMFTLDDLYDKDLKELHFRSGFNGTTDKYMDIEEFKKAVLKFIAEPGAIIATGSSSAGEKNNSWNQLQYYLIHPGCDLTDRNTTLAYLAESEFYWWKNAGEGTAYPLTPGVGDSNITTLMEAVYRAAINGNPHALDNLTVAAAETFRLIPSYTGEEENWADLTKYDASTLSTLKTDLVALAAAAGAANCRTLIWRQIQHYLLTKTYLLATDSNLPTDNATDKDTDGKKNYWWKLGDANPNKVADIKNDLDTFLDIIDQYNAGTYTGNFTDAINLYSGITEGAGSRLNIHGAMMATMPLNPLASSVAVVQNGFRTKMNNIAATLKSQGVKAADALDWFVLQYYGIYMNQFNVGGTLVTKEAAKTYYINTLLKGDLTKNWAPSYVTISGAMLSMNRAPALQPEVEVEVDEVTGIMTTTTPDTITELPNGLTQVQRTVTVLSPEGVILEVTTLIEIYDADYNLISTQTITMPVPEPEEPVCTCGREDGTHAEDCPLYEPSGEKLCTCGREDGTHAEDCPLYEPSEEKLCTCGREDGTHAEDCPLYELSEEKLCTCGSEDGTHAEDCPLYEPSEEKLCTCGSLTDTHAEGCPLYVSPGESLPGPSVPGAETPKVSPIPEVTVTPEVTETSEPTPPPAESETPEATSSPEVTVTPEPTPTPTPEGTLETMPEIVDPDPPASEPPKEPEQEPSEKPKDEPVGTVETTPSPQPSEEAIVTESQPPLTGIMNLRSCSAPMVYNKLTTKLTVRLQRSVTVPKRLFLNTGGINMKQLNVNRIFSPPGRPRSIQLLLRAETKERGCAV